MISVSPFFMCRGQETLDGAVVKKCRERDRCFRHKAEKAESQSWLEPAPRFVGGCSWFMPIEREKKREHCPAAA